MADANYPQIVVTPEMIEAGTNAFAGFNRDFDDERDLVAWIFTAMMEARFHMSERQRLAVAGDASLPDRTST